MTSLAHTTVMSAITLASIGRGCAFTHVVVEAQSAIVKVHRHIVLMLQLLWHNVWAIFALSFTLVFAFPFVRLISRV